MNNIKRKFKSTKGASIVLALLFLLFAMTIGSIMLTSATVNLGRTKVMNTQEQNYLAVKSAASLIEAELKKVEFTGSFTKKSDNTITDVTTKTNPNSTKYIKYIIYPELEEWYKAENGIRSTAPTSQKAKMKISIPQQPEAGSHLPESWSTIPEVTMTFEVKKDYTIEAVLWCDDGKNKSNAITLKSTATLATTETIVPQPNAPDDDGYEDEGTKPSTVKYETKITYKKQTITKGGTTS